MTKWPQQATEENETKKKARQWEELIIYSICHVQVIKSLLLDNFSLRSQQMVPNYFLYPYKYPEFHLRKIWPQFWANRHFPEGDGHDGGLHTNWQIKALPMACNRQSSSWARILSLLILTLSLTQTDSIVAYTSFGSKLQKLKQLNKNIMIWWLKLPRASLQCYFHSILRV